MSIRSAENADRAKSMRPHRTYSHSKALFFKGKNWVLQQIAYFFAGQGVRWSVAWRCASRNALVESRERLQHLRRMLFSCLRDEAPGRPWCYWSSTPINGCGRRPSVTPWPSNGPPSLVRGVAEDGVDPTPLWKTYVDAGWTELTDPENAVELAIVLEELGRATDPTPYLATLTQFAPLAGDRFDPQQGGDGDLWRRQARVATPDGWVLDGNRVSCSSTATGARGGSRVVTDAGVFVVDAG